MPVQHTTTSHDNATLSTAWQRYKDGQCAWAEVQAIQDSLMPRCAAHDVPTATIIDGVPMCAACIQAAGSELALWLKSLGLVAGGVWTAP